ncbi:histone-lysine N-methyltransferase EHMT2 isoform X1 [Nilaparvata lugens]|uniref:histone-lysine N-methyltransferase EHMT2 isoform X1 n=2 Tax=Nilaparvata lugens TaxID=108931 RepID=UPI00193D1EB1|nr:histone-lysine N-methyltransferase EHMT2 isoform X1 [Nilaparvata lugens]
MSGSTSNDGDPDESSASTINSDGERMDSSLIKKILNEMKSEFTKAKPKEDIVDEEDDEEDDDDDDDDDDEEDDECKDSKEVKIQKNCLEKFEKDSIADLMDLNNDEMDDEHCEEEEEAIKILNEQISDDEETSEGDSSKVEDANKNDSEEGEDRVNEESILENDSVGFNEVPEKHSSSKVDVGNRNNSPGSSKVGESKCVPSGSIRKCNEVSSLRPRRSRASITDDDYCEEEDASRQTFVRKRSLRIQSQVKTEPDNREESTSGKRSSRRFSKDFNRESVLQNAIARKEKSFSALNSSEERGQRRSSRTPKQSTIETKLQPNKSPIKPKNLSKPGSTDLKLKPNQGVPEEKEDTNNTNEVNSDSEIKPIPGVFIPTVEFDVRLQSDFSVKSPVISTDLFIKSEVKEEVVDDISLATSYKKPTRGNKRKRPFRGLKYSMRGSHLKSSNRMWTIKRQKKNELEASAKAKDIKVSDIGQTCNEKIANGYVSESNSKKGKEACSEEEKNYGDTHCKKRKIDDTKEDSEEKKMKQNVPSPDVADAVNGPDKPEPAMLSTWNGSNGLCLCSSRDKLYARLGSGLRSELYCQAIDSLDGRLIGCCNLVEATNPRIERASVRVPFQVLCQVHHERLIRHNCCPGCGCFCTQGKFVQCIEGHHYHRDCQATVDNEEVCPHCATKSAVDVNISLGLHKHPVFLPLQKTPKKVPSAKMSFGQSKSADEEEEGKAVKEEVVEEEEDDDLRPLVPPSALILPSALKVAAEGIPTLDKDKLDTLLHVACSLSHPRPRFTLRNMYQAARTGDAEKMVQILASGLNANHQFREWSLGSAMHAACHNGHLAVVHLLVQAGASPDILDKEQNTPLMLAVLAGHNRIVNYLVKAGASVSFKGSEGMTSLHLAAKTGNLEACHYLLSNPNMPRFFIDSVDDGRWTPLVWAAEHCHSHVVRFLLEKRADPLVRDAEQNIALHWAALAGSVEITESLLNYGSEINSTNTHGDTALHIAARQNAFSCVVLLLARGAKVDMHNRAGLTPLECCLDVESPAYKAIKLNLELRPHSSKARRPTKILTNDITRGHETSPVQCINAYDDEGEPQDFVYVTENCFTSNITVDRTITSLQSCKCKENTACTTGCCLCGKISMRCWYDNDGKLLPEFNFADPPMLFECNSACQCNKLTCKNRVVQHGITGRFQLFRTKTNKGWGVQTLRLIQKGTYVCEYIGEIISDCEADTREDDSYLFDLDNRDGETYCIDACRYGNIARFINHMCVPNLLPVRVFIDHQDLHFPRIAFFANRDIMAYEELGFDYGEKFWIIKYKSFTCTCGAEKCRYSQTTIQQTLENYNRKLQLEESISEL